MTSRNLLVVKQEDKLGLAAQMMTWGRLRHVPVVSGDDVVGVISERDILGRQGDGQAERWEDYPAGEVMSHPPVFVTPDEELGQAAARMAGNRVGCLVVVERGRLIGIVTSTDVLSAVVSDLFVQGESLHRPVREAMQEDVLSVRASDDLMEAVELMSARRVRHLPVVGDGGEVVGMLSDRDVRTALGDPAEALNDWARRAGRLHVSAVMSASVITVRHDAPLAEALRHLLGRQVGALPVVDERNRLRGIVSYLDVLRALRKG
jgi:acetoin utilization protein AcuB